MPYAGSMGKKKITTIEELAEVIAAGFATTATASDLANLEEKVDRLAERVNDLADLGRLREQVERIRDALRHELNVEV